MTQQQLKSILDDVFPLVKTVGAFIEKEQKKVTHEDIETKASNSLVTYVDKTAEDMLVSGLAKILPSASFVTEEETVVNQDSELVWIIDPLDGTTNFLCSIPFFSISIALKHRDQMVLGLVRGIMQEEDFYAIAGGGAFRNGKRLHLNQTRPINEAILATGFPYSDVQRTAHYIDVLKSLLRQVRAVRRLGSAALDLAYVACGRFDGYYEKNLNIWDVAAGALLVQEAGGTVSGFYTDHGWKDGSSIIGAHNAVYDVIRNSIAASQPT